MPMETPLRRVRGLGSARSGARHWWIERLTSVSTLLLLVWFAVSLLRLPGFGHGPVTAWLAMPVNAAAMMLLIVSTFWHSKLGLQVFVEDYVHEEGNKVFLILLINFAAIAGVAVGIFAILKIAFAGAAG
jgi:succinate dehydrogenase / fumarate reductase membrane anchor subunit